MRETSIEIPQYHLEQYGRRSFSVAGSSLCNSSLPDARDAHSMPADGNIKEFAKDISLLHGV